MIRAKLASWNWMRALRLIIGVSFIGEAFRDSGQWAFGVLGALLLWQALANKGCEGGSCNS
ncbi:hypothetical protein AUTU_12610 [Aureibacter tunicatorum]|nr:hypothetical protein AUTU_12610 [Aureibacter tunicatorum]